MKTIKVIFTSEYQEMPMGRRYSFNTTLDVKEGDLIETPDYEKKLLQVVTVQEKLYKSFNYHSGQEYEDLRTGKGYGEIKTLSEDSRIITEAPGLEDEGF